MERCIPQLHDVDTIEDLEVTRGLRPKDVVQELIVGKLKYFIRGCFLESLE